MKRKTVVALVLGLSIGLVSLAFADTVLKSPAQIYSDLTDKTVAEAYELRAETEKTYGELAKDAGVYEQFQAQSLEQKKAMIEERVQEGTLTRERANEMIDQLEDCDGTMQRIGQGSGMRFGQGSGGGFGNGSKDGSGFGGGQGRGFGRSSN